MPSIHQQAGNTPPQAAGGMTRAGFKHIANRLLVWILGVCLLIFLGFSLLVYQRTSLLIRHQAQSRAELAVENTVQSIESLLRHVSRGVRTARSVLLAAQVDEAHLLALLQTLVEDKSEVFGMALALEPDTLPGRTRFAPYVYRGGNRLHTVDLASGEYDYLNQPWYRIPVEQNQSSWSEPYYDRGGGNIAMVTFSSPITETAADGTPTTLGVITADVSLQTLSTMVDDIQLGSRGYAYILSASGRIITHDNAALRMARVEQLPIWKDSDKRWQEVIIAMGEQQRGHRLLPCSVGSGELCWLSYEPLGNSDWSILIAIPLADIESEQLVLGRTMLVLGSGAILLLGVLILWLSRRLSRPINQLAEHTGIIAQGTLDQPVPARRMRDEIGTLANNIHGMQQNLKYYIENLTEETARRERLESELDIAASIQGQMLPDGGESNFQQHNFQLAATVVAARQIGGDFYLYQQLDDRRLFFMIGDVSDKGIPAALFMAQSITQIRSLLTVAPEPADLLDALNRKLCQNNENCMFVTAIAAVVDTLSGHCRLASAGHAAPLLKADCVSELKLESGPALGLLEQADYDGLDITLQPGQSLLLYTDGVDEALDAAGQAYGLDRLIQAMERDAGSDCQTLVGALLQDVLDFQQGRIFDDITLLALGRASQP